MLNLSKETARMRGGGGGFIDPAHALTPAGSISGIAARGSEISRTFDQSAFPIRLFLACSGLVRQSINDALRQFGGRCGEFARHPSFRVGPQRPLHKLPYGLGARHCAMSLPPSIDLPQQAPRQCHGEHRIAGGAAAARPFAGYGSCCLHEPSPS